MLTIISTFNKYVPDTIYVSDNPTNNLLLGLY